MLLGVVVRVGDPGGEMLLSSWGWVSGILKPLDAGMARPAGLSTAITSLSSAGVSQGFGIRRSTFTSNSRCRPFRRTSIPKGVWIAIR